MDLMHRRNYHMLLFLLYKFDEILSWDSNPNIQKIIDSINNRLPTFGSNYEFYNMKEEDMVSNYWDGDNTNHWEDQDPSFSLVTIPAEDVFFDEQQADAGYFADKSYNIYYSLKTSNIRVQLLKIIHRLIVTLDFYHPYGYFRPFNVSENEMAKVRQMDRNCVQTILTIDNDNNVSNGIIDVDGEDMLDPNSCLSDNEFEKIVSDFDNWSIINFSRNPNISSLNSHSVKADTSNYFRIIKNS